jgi:hypothetical protein
MYMDAICILSMFARKNKGHGLPSIMFARKNKGHDGTQATRCECHPPWTNPHAWGVLPKPLHRFSARMLSHARKTSLDRESEWMLAAIMHRLSSHHGDLVSLDSILRRQVFGPCLYALRGMNFPRQRMGHGLSLLILFTITILLDLLYYKSCRF